MSYMTSEQWKASGVASKKLETPSKLEPLPRTLLRMEVMGKERKTAHVWRILGINLLRVGRQVQTAMF